MKYFLLTLFAQVSGGDVDLPKGDLNSDTIARMLRVVFGVSGAIALLIITIAGFKYVTSQGNPQETAKAKDTILYAVIGLIVVILAFSIVTFVIGRL